MRRLPRSLTDGRPPEAPSTGPGGASAREKSRASFFAAALALAALAAPGLAARADDHRHGEREGHHGRSERHGREGHGDHDGGEEQGGPLMRPGEDCLSCHDGRGEARRLAAAGTVFRAGGGGAGGVAVTVTVGGRSFTTTTNAAGNFSVTATGPVTAASVSGLGAMPGGAAIDGRCNACHAGDERLAVP